MPEPETNKFKEVHEKFHAHVQPIATVPETDDWMYHYLLQNLARDIEPGFDVLDIGCGNGVLSLYCAKRGCHVLGIDISEKAAEASQIAAGNLGLSKHATFKAVPLEDLPDDQAYDLVVLSEVIEHIPDDVAAMKKIACILKPGGKVYITTPSSYALAHRLRLLLFRHDDFDRRVGHVRRYTKESLAALVQEAGLKQDYLTKGEGPFRNLLLTTRLHTIYDLMLRARLNRAFEFIDDRLMTPLLGEAQIMLTAQKSKQDHGSKR